MSEICPIEFTEFPRIRTSQELFEAAGRLVTSSYACVLQPDSDLSYWAQTIEYDDDIYPIDDPMLQALQVALDISSPRIHWFFDDDSAYPINFFLSKDAPHPSYRDFGVHADIAPSEWSVGVNYHKTERLASGGGVEVTFAIPTAQYAGSDKEQKYLTELLREGRTDSDLVTPNSFRRVRLEEGGCVVFSTYGPGRPVQLHDFRSLSPKRESRSWFLDGMVRKAYRQDGADILTVT